MLICAGDSSIVCFYYNCSVKIAIITIICIIITILAIINGLFNDDIEMAILLYAVFV